MKKSDRPTSITTKAHANAQPRLPNASGSDEEKTSPTNISASKNSRTGNFSGSSQFVTQQVQIYVHHNASSNTRASNPPLRVKWSIKACESCVTAKTNTRS